MGPAGAQQSTTGISNDDQGGALGHLMVGQRLEWEDDDIQGRTILGLEISTRTQTQALDFSLNTDIRERFNNDSGTEVVNPTISFGYERETATTIWSTGVRYRESDIDDNGEAIEIIDGGIEEDLVVISTGTRADLTAETGLTFGRDERIGGNIALYYRQVDYSDINNASLEDSETRGVEGSMDFILTSSITAQVLGDWRKTDSEEDGTDTKSTGLGAGATFRINSVTDATISALHRDIERQREGGSRIQADGIELDAGISVARPTGVWTVSFSSNPGTAGRVDSFSVGRDFEMSTSSLEFSVGMSRLEGTSAKPTLGLSYQREVLREVVLGLSANRHIVTSVDGDEAVNTTLALDYSQPLSEVSSFSGNISLRDTEVLTGTSDDGRRLSLDLLYHRDINNDWGVVAGYRGRRSTSDDSDDDSDRVYIGIEKNYWWRP